MRPAYERDFLGRHPERSEGPHGAAANASRKESWAALGMMDLADFRAYCLAKPNVTEGTPFGADTLVFKVGGKMFALASLEEVPSRVNLKCDPERALDLRDRYEEVQPGYHMNKKHWNTVELGGGIPEAELRSMIDHSYDLVVARLPKRR